MVVSINTLYLWVKNRYDKKDGARNHIIIFKLYNSQIFKSHDYPSIP